MNPLTYESGIPNLGCMTCYVYTFAHIKPLQYYFIWLYSLRHSEVASILVSDSALSCSLGGASVV